MVLVAGISPLLLEKCMAATSGGIAKSNHARVRRHGLWRSGAALMSGSGCNADGGEERRSKKPRRTGRKSRRSEKFLGGGRQEGSADHGRRV